MQQPSRPMWTRRNFVAGLAAAIVAPARAAPPPLMLAREAPADIAPAGWLVSEKYDGVRALWDGRSLRFRSGASLHAPGWFSARLPAVALDGELWLGRGSFEALAGVVRKSVPVDAEWRSVRYMLFDLPGADGGFAERAARIDAIARTTAWPQLEAVAQSALADRKALAKRFEEIVAGGGEGLVLHRADSPWQPGRSDALLKLKPLQDADAVVVGHVAGRGRHEGRLGALRVRSEDGIEFLIGTGFSDSQRAAPPARGSVISFSHRGSTASGVPRFASFLRVRAEP